MKIDSIAVSKPSHLINEKANNPWSSMKRKVFRITESKTCRYINFMSLKKNDIFLLEDPDDELIVNEKGKFILKALSNPKFLKQYYGLPPIRNSQIFINFI